MAYGSNSTINTNQLAMATNRFMNKTAIDVLSLNNAFLFAAMGAQPKQLPRGSATPGIGSFKNFQGVSGLEMEYRWRAQHDPVQAIGVGMSELQPVVASTNDDAFLGGKAPLANHNHKFWIKGSDKDRLTGNEAKGRKFYDEEMDRQKDSIVEYLAQAVHSTNSPTATSVAGWRHYVSATGTCLTIDRSDSANSWLRSYVDDASAALTLARIQKAKLKAVKNMTVGKKLFSCCNDDVYAVIIGLVEGKHQVITASDPWLTFNNGDWVGYAGIRFCLDGYAPLLKLPLINEDAVEFVMNNKGFQTKIIEDDPGVENADQFRIAFWAQLFINNPRTCSLIENITIA